MTREEALGKDEALFEIMVAIRRLPELRITIDGEPLGRTSIEKTAVLQLIQRYGFHG